jgi:hypothetical protein
VGQETPVDVPEGALLGRFPDVMKQRGLCPGPGGKFDADVVVAFLHFHIFRRTEGPLPHVILLPRAPDGSNKSSPAAPPGIRCSSRGRVSFSCPVPLPERNRPRGPWNHCTIRRGGPGRTRRGACAPRPVRRRPNGCASRRRSAARKSSRSPGKRRR